MSFTYSELQSAYPRLAERISEDQWQRMTVSDQAAWALHQAAHAWSLLLAKESNEGAYRDQADYQSRRISTLEAALRETKRKMATFVNPPSGMTLAQLFPELDEAIGPEGGQ